MNLAHPKSRVSRLRALVFAARKPAGKPSALGRLRERVAKLLDSIEEQALAPASFTAVLPLDRMTLETRALLLDRLRQLNEPCSPLLAAPGMRQIQFSLRANAELDASCAFGALVVDCTHEGDREDLLYELFEQYGETLDTVLRECRDYPGTNVRDACVRLLLRAAKARKLAATDRDAPTAASASELVPPLHDFEHEIPNEHEWIRRAARIARTSSRQTTREARRKDPAAKAVRGVHAKHHGLLQAKFIVREDLPLKFQHGAFKPGAEYSATMRLSNMSPHVKPDSARDARGLAIKLDSVTTTTEATEWHVPGEDATSQDFLLASHPVFFVKDVRDYTVFRTILAARGRMLVPRLAVFALRRPRELFILGRSLRRGIGHPLNLAYHSMSAYALGSSAVKYLVRPVTPAASRLRDAPRSNDYLRESLQRSLDPKTGEAMQLEFCVVVPNGVPPSVEDARTDWRPHESTIVPIAMIEIAPQDTSSAERMARAERLVFTPWHTLRAHRPLGSLSRARLAVYRESVEHRSRANREVQTD